ncbi:SET domain-containing protein-lysine N-methyltransferase [Shewanella surugensis]|uniref:SET domain-containing protein-lysine N-methyltransferase n=1 Tax=Shewanella surugensis TaxID=212020 RepID=A0ABT0LCI8_9GAMM|nr:SET domain-containing protein-lysine N-methyltransferase [Shewanella surugensis]MCL1125407.1 SET domain-containing protein-lysine N-methyltransferase [Shewanella surugensis]
MNKKHILNTNYGVIIKKYKSPLQEGLFSRINLLKGFDFGPVLYHQSLIGLFEDEILPHHKISFHPYHRLKNSQYINHSDNPSCVLFKKGKVIHLIAAKPLSENEEITLNFPQACEVKGIQIPKEYNYLLFQTANTEK